MESKGTGAYKLTKENCDKKKKLLKEVDVQSFFCETRDEVYGLKIKEIKQEIEETARGTSKTFLEHNVKNQLMFDNKIKQAETVRRYTLQRINHQFEAERKAAVNDFINARERLVDEVEDELLEQMRSFIAEYEARSALRIKKQNRLKQLRILSRRPVVVGPVIIYMLRDEEIKADLAVINKRFGR